MATTSTYSLSDFSEYKYNANMSFMLNGETVKIDSLYVSSIVTDYNFDSNNMPLIFVTLQLDKYLAKKMIDNSDKGLFVFNLQKYIYTGSAPTVFQDVIKTTFSYFMTDEINRYNDTEKQNIGTTVQSTKANTSADFVETTIGLLAQDHLNNNKKVVNGVIKKSNLSAIIYYVLSNIKNLVIEPITYNKQYAQMILPPMNSVGKSLAYLNSLHAFYDTPYRFFMDFDATYLVSSSGKAIKKKNESIQDIYIEVINDANEASKIQGVCTDKAKNLYYMYVSSADIQLGTNYISDKSFSSLTAVDSSGNKTTTQLSTSGSSGTKAKTQIVRVTNDNAGLINNMKYNLDSSGSYLSISKTGPDTSIFTINKRYHILCKDIFDKDYTGIYLLIRKREIYMQQDDNMAASELLTFKLIQSTESSSSSTGSIKATSGSYISTSKGNTSGSNNNGYTTTANPSTGVSYNDTNTVPSDS